MTTKEFSNENYCVYEHVSPSGKVYIGITNNSKIRFSGSGKRYCTYNSIFSKAIQKYGWENIEHKILINNTTFGRACIVEKALIRFYKRKSLSYNITDGGEGTPGRILSEFTKEKMRSSAHRPSEATFEGIRNSAKSKMQSTINLEKAHAAWRGSNHSEESIALMKAKSIGRAPSKECIDNSIARNSISIVQISKDGKVINTFSSMREAAALLNVNASNISGAIKGKRKSVGGFMFKINKN